MATDAPVQIPRQRIAELIEREEKQLNERTQRSKEMYERAQVHLVRRRRIVLPAARPVADLPRARHRPAGLGRRRQRDVGLPQRLRLDGPGPRPPGDRRGDRTTATRCGTHFAAPTEDAIVVGDELARRWGLPKWRFTNSGSESTMDAIRIARGTTGRETIVKIFGSYHGHHDGVMVSIGVEYDQIGDHENLASLPYGAGIPQAVVDLTIPVPFNDAGAMERRIERLTEEGRKPACVIMEPAMMNLGVVLPEPGYLEAVRDITRRHGIVLIFDEVKTGLCIAAGGATERFGVTPDLVTLAKALGGGTPIGAIGGTEEAMAAVEDGSVYQVGTYNGNPLGMAATRGEPARGAHARRPTSTSTASTSAS